MQSYIQSIINDKSQDVFTLADEARHTSQHDHSIWSSATLLRRKPVTFVSAGLIEPLKQECPSDEEKAPKATELLQDTDNTRTTKSQVTKEPNIPQNDDVASFFFDTARPGGDKPRDTGDRAHTEQVKSLTNRRESVKSNSSEEVILFRGRSNGRSLQGDEMNLDNIRIELSAVESEVSQHPPNPSRPQDVPSDEQPKTRRRGRRAGRIARNRRQNEDSDDEALVADYILNMQGSGEMDELTEYFLQHNARQVKEVHRSSDDDGDGVDTGSSGASGESSDSDTSTDEDVPNPGFNMMTELDGYGRFDPMDWERPSIRRKRGKGAKAKLELNLDEMDSDLERTLQAAWKTDRQKKTERKRQRQELRARGLLSKKRTAEDPRIKYPGGMTTEQVVDELREFLIGDSDRYVPQSRTAESTS